ncbi:MAG: hypothetical protein J6S69_05380, partial [Proteobacteria bacterium]|nr:hypothetical protein [Pseudomonadota bacterium]
ISYQKDEQGMTKLAADDALVAMHTQKALTWPAPQPFKATPMSFNNDVNLSVNVTVPGAIIAFASATDQLPDGLKLENGIASAPFKTQLKRNEQWFSVVAIAEGYENRIVVFQPIQANIELRIPMLKLGANEFTVTWAQASQPVTVAEDLDIELKSMLQTHRETLTQCVKDIENKTFTMQVDANHVMTLAATGHENADKCLAPVILDIQAQRAAGALPDLKPNMAVSVVVP